MVAQTLSKPDRGITGITGCSALLGPKRLQLMKEAIPGAQTISVLWNPSEPVNVVEWEAMQTSSTTVGVKLLSVPVSQPEELAAAFAKARQGSDAICVTGGVFESVNAARIVQLAAQHRLPAIYGFRELVASGGLMSYGSIVPDMYRRAAGYMDRILKGAKPSELPIQQPTSFDLVVNAKTAADLGITLPESLNARVTEVIR
ncbi:MAG: ABC transporter substrate-binding protein [Chloroflexi bacterium]|nr:ABC transporter substrate-binding protein [Chloroflexota bacterium]